MVPGHILSHLDRRRVVVARALLDRRDEARQGRPAPVPADRGAGRVHVQGGQGDVDGDAVLQLQVLVDDQAGRPVRVHVADGPPVHQPPVGPGCAVRRGLHSLDANIIRGPERS